MWCAYHAELMLVIHPLGGIDMRFWKILKVSMEVYRHLFHHRRAKSSPANLRNRATGVEEPCHWFSMAWNVRTRGLLLCMAYVACKHFIVRPSLM